ncbi:unnamed protein product [Cochlearia groenlandica]
MIRFAHPLRQIHRKPSSNIQIAETQMIVPLINLLDDGEPNLAAEVAIALAKFATEDNFLGKDHSRTIIGAGGSKLLVQLAYFGGNGAHIPALVLLSCVLMNAPDSEQLAKVEVLTVLEWASKQAISGFNRV